MRITILQWLQKEKQLKAVPRDESQLVEKRPQLKKASPRDESQLVEKRLQLRKV